MQAAGFGQQKLTGDPAVRIGFGSDLPLPMMTIWSQRWRNAYFGCPSFPVIEMEHAVHDWPGLQDPSANGANATNVTYAAMDPSSHVRFSAVVDGRPPSVENGV